MGMIDPALTREIPTRKAIEDQIEALIALLDALDGDTDLEIDDAPEDGGDAEPDSDDEPWLGWCGFALRGSMGGLDDYEQQLEKGAMR